MDGQMGTLQTVLATKSLFCTSLNQLRALILAVEFVVTPLTPYPLVSFLGLLLLRALHLADADAMLSAAAPTSQ